MVTNKIISALEHGVKPWACPWDRTQEFGQLPLNFKTKKNYSGINILLLWSEMLWSTQIGHLLKLLFLTPVAQIPSVISTPMSYVAACCCNKQDNPKYRVQRISLFSSDNNEDVRVLSF